jgi:hypothetical protein
MPLCLVWFSKSSDIMQNLAAPPHSNTLLGLGIAGLDVNRRPRFSCNALGPARLLLRISHLCSSG